MCHVTLLSSAWNYHLWKGERNPNLQEATQAVIWGLFLFLLVWLCFFLFFCFVFPNQMNRCFFLILNGLQGWILLLLPALCIWSETAVPPVGRTTSLQCLTPWNFEKEAFSSLWHLAIDDISNTHLQPVCCGVALGICLLPDCCFVYPKTGQV